MRAWLRDNGLSICLFSLFLLSQLGLSCAGWLRCNQERGDHGQAAISYARYLASDDFLEATMENWESEFLQMSAFVLLTVVLRQKGSAESKPVDGLQPVDADPRLAPYRPDLPWPVRRGGWVLRWYERSLGLTFFALFLASFALHAAGGAAVYNAGQALHGGAPVSLPGYLLTAQFWFESLQNWQSEFFSIGLMVVLSIFLRQRGSPESKPVATPHAENA